MSGGRSIVVRISLPLAGSNTVSSISPPPPPPPPHSELICMLGIGLYRERGVHCVSSGGQNSSLASAGWGFVRVAERRWGESPPLLRPRTKLSGPILRGVGRGKNEI